MIRIYKRAVVGLLGSITAIALLANAAAGGGKPDRFQLFFQNAYLVHVPGGSTQLGAEGNVISYGQDWEIVSVKPFLFHVKRTEWDFYWHVNTSRGEVNLVRTTTNFGRIGDAATEPLKQIRVEAIGNKDKPERFFLRFTDAYMIHVPDTSTLQFAANGMVINRGETITINKESDTVYTFRQEFWRDFYWKVNTERARAYRVTDPMAPCDDTPLPGRVSVVGGNDGTNYTVYGCVYTASERDPEEEYPAGALLADLPEDTVLDRETLTAVAVKPVVSVQIENAATGAALLATAEPAPYGDYTVSFAAPAGTVTAAVRVSDGVTSTRLHTSAATTLSSAAPQTRHALVPGDVTDETGSIPFPTTDNTGLFTRVGAIELAHISANGFANPPGVATAFANAPFGSTLTFKGAFTENFYPNLTGEDTHCYKVRLQPPSGAAYYLDTPLNKYRYTVLRSGRVEAEQIAIGPFTAGSVSDCYRLTPLSTRPGRGAPADAVASFVSAPDTLVRWPTGTGAGLHRVSLELYAMATSSRVSLLRNDNLEVELFLDNEPVRISFDQMDVISVLGGVDQNLLENKCAIAQLSGDQTFRIDATAQHPTGFLADWSLSARSNSGVSAWREGASYSGGTFSGVRPPPFVGRLDTAPAINKRGADFTAGPCAYVFSLHARARTTNGYTRYNRKHAQTFYFVQP